MSFEEKIYRMLENILNLDSGKINESTNLKEIDEWDSISMIQFISDFSHEFKKTIKIIELEKIEYVNEIFKYNSYS